MPVAKQVTLPLAAWADLDVPLLQIDGGGAYIPIKPLCQELLGTDDVRPQRQRIKQDPILSQLTCYLPVQTAGGTQDMLCLSWLGIGRWIDRALCRPASPPRSHPLGYTVPLVAEAVSRSDKGHGAGEITASAAGAAG